MRKKTIWTVVAGTSAAVLVPGVAYALVAGGASMPTEGPGIGNAGSDTSVGDPASVGDSSEQSVADAADLAIERAPDELAGSDGPAVQVPSPQQVPAVETLSSAGSPLSPISAMPAVTAVSAISAPSAQSPAPAPKTTTQRAPEAPKPSTTKQTPKQTPKQTSKETTKKAPAPKQTVQSAPSPVSAQSADSPDSPQSADDDD